MNKKALICTIIVMIYGACLIVAIVNDSEKIVWALLTGLYFIVISFIVYKMFSYIFSDDD
jgi:hypothetical protein